MSFSGISDLAEPFLSKNQGFVSKDSDVTVRTQCIATAAWQLEDAHRGDLFDDYPTCPEAREAYIESVGANIWYRRALLILIVLTVFETPAWCHNRHASHFFKWTSPEDQCTIDGVPQKYVLLSQLPYMPLGWGIIMECFLVLMMLRKLLLELRLQVEYFSPLHVTYKNEKVVAFGLTMVGIEIIDALWFIFYRPNFRIAFIPRTGYLCLLPGVQRLVRMIFSVMGEFLSIACFFVGVVIFYAWIVTTLFKNDEEHNHGLDTLHNSVHNMMLAGTTDNFLDIFLELYTENRATGILWLFFLVTAQVFLLSLVLDSLVAAYMTNSESETEEQCAQTIAGILASFSSISHGTGDGDVVSKEAYLDFIREFNRSPSTTTIPLNIAEILFDAVDVDRSGYLNKIEFCEFSGMLQNNFWTTRPDSCLKVRCPHVWTSPWFTKFRAFVESGGFDTLMNWVLVLNLCLVIAETRYDLAGWDETPLMEDLELCFSLVYVVELALKLCVWSFGEFWSYRANQFDFFTTWLLLLSSILDLVLAGLSGKGDAASPGASALGSKGIGAALKENSASNVKRYVNILRLLRLLRVMKRLKNIPAFSFMCEILSKIVVASADIIVTLGVVLFFFTTLSVQMWGGLLYETNPLLKGTEYDGSSMYVLGFNDVSLAFAVWFSLLLTEWNGAYPEAIIAADVRFGSFTSYLFHAFFVIAVSIVFQLAKAFTISVYADLKQQSESGEASKELGCLADLTLACKNDGLTLHVRTVGDDSLQSRLVEVLEHMAAEESEEENDEEAESEAESKLSSDVEEMPLVEPIEAST
eukprot:TRINITY_DN67342_c0_g1_i1.p1 TRINITY_DN67342_c0_g1~~TRINITY_DN67342_c0_g1_i1.p1  ORF type:complete len:809 (-),score=138.74 TRINITY_DN67342_c0_g1_i1:87-2513(-)